MRLSGHLFQRQGDAGHLVRWERLRKSGAKVATFVLEATVLEVLFVFESKEGGPGGGGPF